ncbi:MAG: YicC/YloC family endoribonuclease, partial [Verrucomicrobiales bacterium]
AATNVWTANVETSSVNRKQAEVVVQAPRELNGLDARIRKTVLDSVSRGRVQVSITLERAEGADEQIRIDTRLAKSFHDAFCNLGKTVGHPLLPTASDYLRQPGILAIGETEIDDDEAWQAIEPALAEALANLVAMRETEGSHLKQDFLRRLETLRSFRQSIAKTAPERLPRQRDLLLKRLRDSGLEIDLSDERVLKELALFADRCDISEEITRLDSHFAKFAEYLDAPGPQGRALDFLCQELFREFNTIGSKANDASIAQTIVEAKTELEKIREQVQNAE